MSVYIVLVPAHAGLESSTWRPWITLELAHEILQCTGYYSWLDFIKKKF